MAQVIDLDKDSVPCIMAVDGKKKMVVFPSRCMASSLGIPVDAKSVIIQKPMWDKDPIIDWSDVDFTRLEKFTVHGNISCVSVEHILGMPTVSICEMRIRVEDKWFILPEHAFKKANIDIYSPLDCKGGYEDGILKFKNMFCVDMSADMDRAGVYINAHCPSYAKERRYSTATIKQEGDKLIVRCEDKERKYSDEEAFEQGEGQSLAAILGTRKKGAHSA